MTHLPSRLRKLADDFGDLERWPFQERRLLREAADEIQRLQNLDLDLSHKAFQWATACNLDCTVDNVHRRIAVLMTVEAENADLRSQLAQAQEALRLLKADCERFRKRSLGEFDPARG